MSTNTTLTCHNGAEIFIAKSMFGGDISMSIDSGASTFLTTLRLTEALKLADLLCQTANGQTSQPAAKGVWS